jgi:hypothetical protein
MPIGDRYPSADVLSQRGHWDAATRHVVIDRVRNVPGFAFFDPSERQTLEALCARVIPQAHRPPGRRVPIAPRIDELCAHGHGNGFRFDDMPPDQEAWRIGLHGLDEAATALHGRRFAELEPAEQDAVLQRVRAGDPPGEAWQQLNVRRWWVQIALRQISGVYYAHPYAWDEIGFGGPAYPRGYFALNFGAPEPWEAREARER